MTPENFCYWLQGFIEIENPKTINTQQVQEIKNHLQLVFEKKTPTIKQQLENHFCSQELAANYLKLNKDLYDKALVQYMDNPASC